MDQRNFGVYGRDWRAAPVGAWRELMAGRETGQSDAPETPVAVLSRDQFAVGVKDALRAFSHPTALRDNPLLYSRLVSERVAPDDAPAKRAEILRELLLEASAKLEAAPRQTKFYRALFYTYIEPAPSQEEAAELLELPFSTFRRHLQSGLQEITELLWQSELGRGQ